MSCVLVDQVKDTYKWDNVPPCEESKRMNFVRLCRPLQAVLRLREARIKTCEFSVRSCRAKNSKSRVERDRIEQNSQVLTLASEGHSFTSLCPPLDRPRHKTQPRARVWFLVYSPVEVT